MLAVLGGLSAAALFALATLLAARGVRLVGAPSWLAGVMTVGLLVVLPCVCAAEVPALDGATIARLVISGAGNVAGLLLAYTALRSGQVSVVAPILSTEGAVAAVFAVVAGEHLGSPSAVMLGVIVVGVVLVARQPRKVSDPPDAGSPLRPAILSAAAACCFGASLYATGTLGTSVSLAWALLPARAIGVATVAVPIAVRRRMRMTRRAAPFVVLGGLCELGGFAAFTLGARHGIAVSAVLASQFATLAAIAGTVIFRERLARTQVAGVVTVAIGVAFLTALRA